MKHLRPQNLPDPPPITTNRKGYHPISTCGYRFNRRIWLAAVCLMILIYGIGCSGMSNYLQENSATKLITGATEKERRQKILLSDRLQLRASEYENNGELPSALLCWQILSILNPADREYANKFNRLSYESHLLADQHFEKGMKFFNKKAYKSARREFLSALRYNPDHTDALTYLKEKMNFQINTLYQIQESDSLVSIAQNIYRDPNKNYLIAVYNDLDLNQKLITGNFLKLPSLEPDLNMPLVDITGKLKTAKKLFLNQEYALVLKNTSDILRIDPSNIEAAELKNAALYQIADRLRQQHNYLESLATLEKMDPRYKGVQKDIAEVKVLLQQQAEENYRIGVNFFVNEQIKKAIESWEKTLIQNPHHPKARQDIEKARRLLNKLKEVD